MKILLQLLIVLSSIDLLSQTPINPSPDGENESCFCGEIPPEVNACAEPCSPMTSNSPYYFWGCMSQDVMKRYLASAGFYNHPMACTPLNNPNNACDVDPQTNCFRYREQCNIQVDRSCVDEELLDLKDLGIKYMRTYADWGGAENGYFGEEKLFANMVHCQVDPEIILEVGIQEVICGSINSAGLNGGAIPIPGYVKKAFQYTGPEQHFSILQMGYPDIPPDNSNCITPDISRIMTKMWYYYVGTQFILHGYEAIHMGNWWVIVGNDPTHEHIWEVMCKLRAFGKKYARRKFVLINGGAMQEVLQVDLPGHPGANVDPYLHVAGAHQQLLFDFLVMPIDFKETYCVDNPANPFYVNPGDQRLDRLIKLRDDFANFSFGGIAAQPECNNECVVLTEVPYLLQLDQGGHVDPNSAFFEGKCTNDDPDCANDVGKRFLTWGWGGEITYMHFLSTPIRQQMMSYLYYEIQKRSGGNGFFFLPIKQPLSSHNFHNLCGGTGVYYFHFGDCDGCQTCNLNSECPGDRFICERVEDPIKKILVDADQYHVEFCQPQVIHTNFSAEEGWTSGHYPRFMMDVNGDKLLDIVGLGQSNILVSMNQGQSFNPGQANWGTQLTADMQWSLGRFRSFGYFNADDNADLIGIRSGVIYVGYSNGSTTFNFSTYSVGAPAGGKWFIGKFNADALDDLLWLSTTTSGVATARLYVKTASGFATPQIVNYNYLNINQLSVEDINNDGVPDIVGLPNGVQGNSELVRAGLILNGTLPAILAPYETTMKLDCMTSEPTDCCCNFESSNCQEGWNTTDHVRTFGDVDGDGDPDIILFGEEGVMVAKNEAPDASFAAPEYWIYNFGSKDRAGGWNNTEHIRTIGDVNGDGMDDVVGFGEFETFVMLSAGNYFIAPVSYPAFADEPTGGGWDVSRHQRMLVDFDKDGKVEIVGFGETDVWAINCSNAGGPFFRPANPRDELEMEVADKLKVYPNPFFNEINIQLQASIGQTAELTLVNIYGQVVQSKSIELTNEPYLASWNIPSDLPSGTYIVKVAFSDGSMSFEVLKKAR